MDYSQLGPWFGLTVELAEAEDDSDEDAADDNVPAVEPIRPAWYMFE
jgi:hypothetical protein